MSASVAQKHDPETFELGLIAAGAVSAGAYTAGVLDMLFQALDAFEAARDSGDPEAPTHKIKLSAMVGASAGAMNAAIVAAWGARGFTPMSLETIDSPEARRRNPFAWAWIDQPHVTRLLDTADLQGGRMGSVLNGEWLAESVDEILSPSGTPRGLGTPDGARARKWLADLRVRLTVGNLTGTPFELTFDSSGQRAGGMMDHAEVMDFRTVPNGPDDPRHYLDLPPVVSRHDPGWAGLGQAALASGAFPGALPSRLLDRAHANRAPRSVFLPKGDPENPDAGAWETLTAKPTPPDGMLCVDGGIANNEPVELCREALLLQPGGRLERDPEKATRSMVMIDPFPDGATLGPTDPRASLPKLLAALVAAFKNQARYRPVDLRLAVRGGAFSRQLLAPSADGRPEGAPALAGGSLGGFFGFFDETFRKHDFLLGRHNCRSFLRRHFVVPAVNPVVRGWALDGGNLSSLARMVRAAHGLHAVSDPKMADKVPLVWLAPALRAEAASPQPAWPAGRFNPAPLDPWIVERAKLLVGMLAEQGGTATTIAAKLFGGMVARRISRKAQDALRQARDQARL